MNDMNEIVSKKIDDLNFEIEGRTRRLQKIVKEFQQYAASADAYDIVTFLPSKIREIEWEGRRIDVLGEQARMLAWMAKEAQK